jgi:RNA polymerase sigma factor (sigma-70 family)
VGNCAAQLWQLSQLLAQRLNQLIALRREIEDFIADLQPEERRILRLYYIEGLTWEQTAERLEYSVRQINRKQHQIMQQLFPNDTKKQAS